MSSETKKVSDSIDPHQLSPLKLQVYWALDQLENAERDRFSINEVVDYLVNNPRITISPQAVRQCLLSDKKSAHKNGNLFKLMQQGRNQLDTTQRNLFLIEPEKPFSGKRLATNEIFSQLKGEILICDPYCGPGLLDFIFKSLKKESPVKIITQKVIDKPAGTFSRTLKDLKQEGFTIQIKIYDKSILHDRYVIDDRKVWLSGNSFNDLGNKESFIIALSSDLRQSVVTTFNSRWKAVSSEYQ